MSQNEQYDPKVLRKLQLAELEVFKDFIKICDEYDISKEEDIHKYILKLSGIV